MRVTLDQATHTYTDDSGLKYKSVSAIIGEYKQPFDPNKVTETGKTIMENYVEKHGGTEEVHLQAWEDNKNWACDKGTAFHDLKEMVVNAQGYYKTAEGDILPVRNIELVWQAIGEGNFHLLPPGVYTELILWNYKAQAAGTADVVVIYPDRTFDIDDYKTNGKFKTTPWYDRQLKRNRMMKFPCFELPDCHLGHYTVQLNLYAWFLIQFGLTPRNLRILHYDIPEEDVPGIVEHGILPDIKPTIHEVGYDENLTKNLTQQRIQHLKTFKHANPRTGRKAY